MDTIQKTLVRPDSAEKIEWNAEITGTVSVSMLAGPEEKKLVDNAAALFVRYDGKVYAVFKSAQVPAQAELVRDTQGQLCGIPAVAGG